MNLACRYSRRFHATQASNGLKLLHPRLELLHVLPAADAPSMFVKEDMSVEVSAVGHFFGVM